jgi:hypothetical protein
VCPKADDTSDPTTLTHSEDYLRVSQESSSRSESDRDREATIRVDATNDNSNSVASVIQGQIVLLVHAMDELREQVLSAQKSQQ